MPDVHVRTRAAASKSARYRFIFFSLVRACTHAIYGENLVGARHANANARHTERLAATNVSQMSLFNFMRSIEVANGDGSSRDDDANCIESMKNRFGCQFSHRLFGAKDFPAIDSIESRGSPPSYIPNSLSIFRCVSLQTHRLLANSIF